MLLPKRTKYRKQHKGRIHGEAKAGYSLAFGSYGLKALEPERITARQIESARRAITRAMKRQGKLWIRIFPDIPVTSKAIGVRQGKGKGVVDFWVSRVQSGRILFELDGISEEIARNCFSLAAYKLPIKTKIVSRLEVE